MSTPTDAPYKLAQRDSDRKMRRSFLPREFVKGKETTRHFPDGSIYAVQPNGQLILKKGKRG